MRIAVNTRFLLKHKMEGFGWFTYETARRITRNHPEHEFIFFFDRAYDDRFIFSENITPVVLNPPARHPILFKIWFDYSVTKALKKYNADVFFSPDGYLSLKTNVPQIAVIHDLNFEHYPQDLPRSHRKYLQKHFPLFAEKAEQIVTVSKYSEQDIIKTYGIQSDKITVAYIGASDAFHPLAAEKQQRMRDRYSEGEEYFLFVGALHPRKNLQRLLEAFRQFKMETNSQTKFLIVGEALWKNAPFKTHFDNFKYENDIHFTGHLPIERLTQVMASAKALAFVSYFEGFGIPLVEAMRAHCPILCGDQTALPEIAGDAALFVDPFSTFSIKSGLAKMDADAQLRAQLVEKGKMRAREFSWDKTAEKLWKTIAQ